MDSKELSLIKKIILVVVLLIAFFVIVEILLRNISKTTKEETAKKEVEEQQQKYEETVEYKEEVYLNESIQTTMNWLKSGDYDRLYEALDPVYKAAMGYNNSEELKTYLMEYLGEPFGISLADFENINDIYYCSVFIDIEQGSEKRLVTIKPIEGDEENFYIMFDEISDIHVYDDSLKVRTESIMYKMVARIIRDKEIIHTFEITNKTDKTIKGSLENLYTIRSDRNKYYPTNSDELANIELAPGETKTMKFILDYEEVDYTSELYNVFVIKYADGKEEKVTMDLELY